ncbi:hypothetical protein GCM10010363_60540 [Streptomyces omiyaensis]|uniref:hypothetical protein n=1 Tax=Streptomyces omiyaensis TaxID=68247 RepID=UPI001675B6D0|nr:hypothetical protein [Streptomyces omiyaensis]GGY71221.1 hypothetical protein GCM10010363_60540 [Streptomyces omiyaensis]
MPQHTPADGALAAARCGNDPRARLSEGDRRAVAALGLLPTGDEPEHRNRLVRLPPKAEETRQRVRFAVELSYSLWGLDAATANRLALLAAELVEHVADRVHSSELALDADLDARTATLRVIALDGTVREPLDPAALPQITSGDQTGVTPHAFGPSVYVKAEVDRP